MDDPEKSLIYFHKPGLDLAQAQIQLVVDGMTVTRDGEMLRVRWGDQGPELRVRYLQGEKIRLDAVQKGRGTPHESLLRTCDAAFEISFDSLDQVLDDINTLIEVQRILQTFSEGVTTRSWNDELSGPGDDE